MPTKGVTFWLQKPDDNCVVVMLKKNVARNTEYAYDTTNAKQKQAYLVHAILNDGIHFVFVQSSYPIFSTKQSHVSFWKASCYFWKVLSENFTDMFVRFIVFNEIPY